MPAAIAVGTLLAGLVLGWAGKTLFAPPVGTPDELAFARFTVEEGSVESSIDLNTVVEWTRAGGGLNLADGIVTSVDVASGSRVDAGTRLFSVNLRPVIAIEGAVPAFRALSRGSSGTDVAQLQAFLIAAGYYRGAADGVFGGTTATAVKSWQRALGLAADGVVQMGDVIFFKDLPATIAISDDLEVGAAIAFGAPAVDILSAFPTFTIPVTPTQAEAITNGAPVNIQAPDSSDWTARVADREVDAEGAISLILESADEQPICRESCSLLSSASKEILPSDVIVVPKTSGLVVPTSAIRSISGDLFVVDISGERHVIEVVASARGMSVVTGLKPGQVLRVPAA